MATRSRATARASTSTTSKFKPENRPFQPYGSAVAVWRSKRKEILMSGPAGTGKSRGVLEKVFALCLKYPGCRVLIVRKTRASLTESALVTWEEKVVPYAHPCLDGPKRRFRQSYSFPNGSEVVIGGLDNPTKIMSTEWDAIYVQEAIEVDEDDWEKLTTRLRNGVVPYQQIVGDTNPDKPSHWLLQRCNSGKTEMIDCRHEDNPVLFDQATGEMTTVGREYIATLDNLTGARKQRLRYGKWVQAEGVVYEEYDRAVHLVNRFEIPANWRRWLCIDFGFTNPFVAQWWAMDPDGRLYRYREIYRTGVIVADHAKEILELSQGETFEAVVCDHDAEDRATFERETGWVTTAAKKTVSDGIQAMKARLRPAGDGKARIFYLRDSLVHRDEALEAQKKPCCTEEEFDGYVWAKPANPNSANAQKKGEEPVKKDDHGMDDSRYMVAEVDLKVPVEIVAAPPVPAVPATTWGYRPR